MPTAPIGGMLSVTSPLFSRSDASAPSATPTEKVVSSTVSTPSSAPRPCFT